MKTITYNEQTHRLVPVEPTENMAAAGWDDAVEHEADNVDIYDIAAIYRVMLSAAPQPEPVEVEPFGQYAAGEFSISTDGGPNKWRERKAYKGSLYTAPPDYEAVKKQRDELVKALESSKLTLEVVEALYPGSMLLPEEIKYIDATLASVKGEKK